MQVNLTALSYRGSAPFTLNLDGAGLLQCLEVVRRIPGRRIVCRAQWNGRAVFAKIFIGGRAESYAARDYSGSRRLIDAGIPAPSILFFGKAADTGAQVVLYEEILQSQSAGDVLEKSTPEQRLELAVRLVRAIAGHHQAGLMQTDLHPKNFLVQGERLYTIDGDAIRPLSRFFAYRQAICNLALLLSKFDPVELEDWLPALLLAYKEVRHGEIRINTSGIRKLVVRYRYRVAHGYADKKVFRQCTDVSVSRSKRHFMAVNRQFDESAIKLALLDPDAMMQAAGAQLLKDGNTCTVVKTRLAGLTVVIKRYNIKNFWHALGRAFRPSRAARSWANAHRLAVMGVATAKPVALLEKRVFGLRREAYFVMEYLDAPDAAEFFDSGEDASGRSEAALNIGQLFYRLCLMGLEHGDCKATNIKIIDRKPVLIDLDSMRQHRCRWFFSRRHVRDLRRFMRNWQQPETARLMRDAFASVYKENRLLKAAGI